MPVQHLSAPASPRTADHVSDDLFSGPESGSATDLGPTGPCQHAEDEVKIEGDIATISALTDYMK
ncbi:hypothetical protein [Streptomyces sp. NBC_01508]|uniref:hypothetical protein n=1 Tax=Streptomyces sp. NBC_01508 TaxID=2903888 RepID=UPI0038645A30